MEVTTVALGQTTFEVAAPDLWELIAPWLEADQTVWLFVVINVDFFKIDSRMLAASLNLNNAVMHRRVFKRVNIVITAVRHRIQTTRAICVTRAVSLVLC